MNRMDDSISRQAAIDALKNRWKKTRNYEGIGDDIAEECELYLKQVPSAQPEWHESPKNALYIRKADAIEICMEQIESPINTYFEKGTAEIIKEKITELPSVQPEKRTEKRTETHACDLIDREAAVDAIYHHLPSVSRTRARTMLHEVPSVQPENQVHLCDSCRHVYPECPSEEDDVIYGNGKGNDNICACNKYEPSAQPEQKWIPCSERLPEKDGRYQVTRYDYVTNTEFIDILWYEENLWWNRHSTGDYAVTAWMPLPEPYKEGEQE